MHQGAEAYVRGVLRDPLLLAARLLRGAPHSANRTTHNAHRTTLNTPHKHHLAAHRRQVEHALEAQESLRSYQKSVRRAIDRDRALVRALSAAAGAGAAPPHGGAPRPLRASSSQGARRTPREPWRRRG